MTTSLRSFEIIASSPGHSFGIYEGADEASAIQAMLDDAGETGAADADIVAKEVEAAPDLSSGPLLSARFARAARAEAARLRTQAAGCTGPESDDLLVDLFAPEPASKAAPLLVRAAEFDGFAAQMDGLGATVVTFEGLRAACMAAEGTDHTTSSVLVLRGEALAGWSCPPRAEWTDADVAAHAALLDD